MKNYKVNKHNVLILGITGQDGSLLASSYLKKKHKVFGYLTTNNKNFSNLKKLGIFSKIKLFSFSKDSIEKVILKTKCKYIFFLSGLASVAKGNVNKYDSLTSNNYLLIRILEFLRKKNMKNTKILNASSSEIFGKSKKCHTEESAINPASYYGLAKSISTEIARSYRLQFGIKIFNAILFNHESPLRSTDYAIQKIISKTENIFLKKSKKINLGNLEVTRDWGWAPEYVEIMSKVINLKTAGDFIICTGKNTQLKNIVKKIFFHYHLDYKKFVKISASLFRSYEIKKISGNNNKLAKKINYKPKILINEIIKKMIKKEY